MLHRVNRMHTLASPLAQSRPLPATHGSNMGILHHEGASCGAIRRGPEAHLILVTDNDARDEVDGSISALVISSAVHSIGDSSSERVTVMNYDYLIPNLDEPGCSLHPIDVMAAYALYQTVPRARP